MMSQAWRHVLSVYLCQLNQRSRGRLRIFGIDKDHDAGATLRDVFRKFGIQLVCGEKRGRQVVFSPLIYQRPGQN